MEEKKNDENQGQILKEDQFNGIFHFVTQTINILTDSYIYDN